MEAQFYKLSLRKLGIMFWLEAEPADVAPGLDRARQGPQPVRFRTETEALRALDGAKIGHWTTFPEDGIHATLSRVQMRTLGFRGNL